MNQHTSIQQPDRTPTDVEPPMLTHSFRDGFRQLASGVCIVTSRHEGENFGIAATSVTSLSTTPPSLLVCINRNSSAHDRLLAVGKFCVNVLAAHHQYISACFGSPARKEERFVTGDWHHGDVPVLSDALASFECELIEAPQFGSHSIIIGRIGNVQANGMDQDPLLYFRGAYL